MVTSDDHKVLAAMANGRAVAAVSVSPVALRCNAAQHVPKVSMRTSVAADLRDVFNAPTRNEADRRLAALTAKYRAGTPQLADWLETNIPEGLTVFRTPPTHRVRLRKTNMLENVNKKIQRRTRVAGLFQFRFSRP